MEGFTHLPYNTLLKQVSHFRSFVARHGRVEAQSSVEKEFHDSVLVDQAFCKGFAAFA